MTIYTATHTYSRPGVKPGLRQLLGLLNGIRIDTSLLRSIAKVLLVVLPVVLAINLAIALSIGGMERSLVGMDNQRHQLMDKNIGLLATKARLYAPENIQRLAGQKLALYVAEKEQVARFNRRHGTFQYN